MGATVASEQTAEAEGQVERLRFDPFAMLQFCGYDMAEYWRHWLDVGERLGTKAPRDLLHQLVPQGDNGRYFWPGFGDNVRVLDWIVARLEHEVDAVPSSVGLLPTGTTSTSTASRCLPTTSVN